MSQTEIIDVPRAFKDLARRRTRAFIVAAAMFPEALDMMLTSAYAQGLEDALTCLEARGKPEVTDVRAD